MHGNNIQTRLVPFVAGDIARFRADAYAHDERRSYFNTENLIKDEWDAQSIHAVAYKDQKIIGCMRLSKTQEGRLPLSNDFPEIAINSDDVEIGRALVKSEARNGFATLALIAAFAPIIEKHNAKRIYANILYNGIDILGQHSFTRMGFAAAGYECNRPDDRYNMPSRLYVCTAPQSCVNWATTTLHKLSRRQTTL